MDAFLSEREQKYSYEDYQTILIQMSKIVRKFRDQSIVEAKRNAFWQNLVEYPIKLLLGTSLSGGAIELFGNTDQPWVSYVRTVLEFIAMILLTTKDFGKFEKKKQKYIQAQTLLSSFNNILKQQIKIKRGFEGDREDVIKEFTDSFENIKGSNVIVQEFGIVDDISSSQNIEQLEKMTDEPEKMTDAYSSDSSSLDDEVDLEALEEGVVKKPTLAQYKSMRQAKCSTALITDMLDRLS